MQPMDNQTMIKDLILKSQQYKKKLKYQMYSQLTNSLISYCQNNQIANNTFKTMIKCKTTM